MTETKGGEKVQFIARHGDLLIKSVSAIPVKGVVSVVGNVLAVGETTNHKHALRGMVQMYANVGQQEVSYFEAKEDTVLTHEEHKPIEIPLGTYQVIREREFSPFEEAIKQVVD